MQFRQDLVVSMAQSTPKLDSSLPLLERAKFGIEIEGAAQAAAAGNRQQIRAGNGSLTISLLLQFLQLLAEATSYHMLSTVPMRSSADDAYLNKVRIIAS